MLLEKKDFIKLEQSLCLFRYIIIFSIVFNLETDMYYNESLFESVSILSVMTSVWAASIYQLCKKYGTTYRRQYYLGIIEWLVDLIILDLFAYVMSQYGNGFVYFFMILLGIIAFIRYENSIVTALLIIGLLGNTFFVYKSIYKYFYALKIQRFYMSVAIIILISYWFYYIVRKHKKSREKISRLQREVQQLKIINQSVTNLYSMNTAIYQAITLEEVVSQLLKNIYKLIEETGIGIILYDENGIESNSKMYTYEEVLLNRGIGDSSIPFKSVYVQKEIENIREYKAYKNCILNFEPIVLNDKRDGLDYTYTILPGNHKKYVYMFNLMKDNKECGLILINVQDRLEIDMCRHINEIVNHAGIVLFKLQKLETAHTRAIYDQLTGAKTRHYMEEVLPRYEKKIKHIGGCIGVLFIDIDHFKSLNDRYGHATGDLVLKTVSHIIQATFSKESLVIRYGGEEFVVIIPSIQKNWLEEKTYDLCKYIEQYDFKKMISDASRITVSIGGAFYPDDDVHIEDVIKKADEAMYQVKKSTRNNVCFYNTIMGDGGV